MSSTRSSLAADGIVFIDGGSSAYRRGSQGPCHLIHLDFCIPLSTAKFISEDAAPFEYSMSYLVCIMGYLIVKDAIQHLLLS